ncbi:hypothetical protein Psuf_000800 [Phytohabitans suffuscus]|uniref:Uncharacterized protein n=1 Tax=Phytohabitans suffuscus TaxID=624315 RepID=A0A6F8Y9L9_9ACTN|nr:hypothetical protein Psuf_000800 [Phytohabitans suffuscus]
MLPSIKVSAAPSAVPGLSRDLPTSGSGGSWYGSAPLGAVLYHDQLADEDKAGDFGGDGGGSDGGNLARTGVGWGF